jgi:hypothetical protein
MEINEQNVEANLHRFTQIYPEDKSLPENKIPKDTPVIVYCSNGEPEHTGWADVDEVSDLGFTELIARSWVTREEFLSW